MEQTIKWGIIERLALYAFIIGFAGVVASVTLPSYIQEYLSHVWWGSLPFWISLTMVGLAFLVGICDLFLNVAFRIKGGGLWWPEKRMIPFVGMIVFGAAFIGCMAWYFWPSKKEEAFGSILVGPMLWQFPPGIQLAEDEQRRLHVFIVHMGAKNVSETHVIISSASIISNLTGETIELRALVGGTPEPLNNVNSIPPNAHVDLVAMFGQTVGPDKGPLAVDFISKWSKLMVMATYDAYEYKQSFDLEPEIRKAMAGQGSNSLNPAVTKKAVTKLNIF